jgi:hypothetical protein
MNNQEKIKLLNQVIEYINATGWNRGPQKPIKALTSPMCIMDGVIKACLNDRFIGYTYYFHLLNRSLHDTPGLEEVLVEIHNTIQYPTDMKDMIEELSLEATPGEVAFACIGTWNDEFAQDQDEILETLKKTISRLESLELSCVN